MLKTLKKFIVLTFKLKPSFYLVSIFSALLNASRLLIGVYAIKFIIDSVIINQIETSLYIALTVVIAQTLIYFLTKWLEQVNRVISADLRFTINRYIVSRIMQFEYEKLEDPYYLDLRERAKFAADNQGVAQQLLFYVTTFISSAISIVSLGFVLLVFDYWIIVALLIAFALHVIIFTWSTSFQVALTNSLIPINRKAGYYLNTLLEIGNAKDYRFSNMNRLIHEKTSVFINSSVEGLYKNFIGMTKFGFASDVVNYLQMGFTYIYIAMKAIAGIIPLSEFILYTSTAISLSTQLAEVVGNIANLKRNVEWIKPLFQLLEVKLQNETIVGEVILESIESIEFDNVSFTYPNTDAIILKDISFKINKGEKISVVGLNGAGKTTIVKLISRFYHPTKGVIKINGIDIWQYQYDSYIKKIAAVFQDYKVFSYSIAENIAGFDDAGGAMVAASKVSLTKKIESLKDGIHSFYSKSLYEHGIELSGGEQQKIAIARALYKDSDLIILDEPTASLDPIAEAEIYEHFNDLVKDKTAIYISHRMSSSVFCDKVLVINQGVVEDFAKHQELMKKTKSLYYELFTTQAKNYNH